MGFEQAAIAIVNVEQYGQLAGSIRRVFAANDVEKFLRKVASAGVSVRDFEAVLERRLLELADERLAETGKSARQLYGELTVSDQGQIRELYLTELENVDAALRAKYNKIYRYY